MKWLLLWLAFASGCAKAEKENEIIGGLPLGAASDASVGRGRGDGGTTFNPDASPFDAPQDQVTLSQTSSQSVVPLNSVSCTDTEDTYFRVFTPSANNITNTLHVTEVSFGIQSAAATTGGTQAAVLQISPYTGTPGGDTLDPTKIGTAITSVSIEIADTGDAKTMQVPIAADVPAGTTFAVVLDVAGDGEFYFGTNSGTETAPGYIATMGCDVNVPTSMQSVSDTAGFTTTTVMVMSVTGTH